MELKIIESGTLEQIEQGVKELLAKSRKVQSPKTREEWMDNQEVCILLNISKRTLQSYRDRGILSFSQIGHKCYYRVKDIEQFVADAKTKTNYKR
jgi:hypothetical protein